MTEFDDEVPKTHAYRVKFNNNSVLDIYDYHHKRKHILFTLKEPNDALFQDLTVTVRKSKKPKKGIFIVTGAISKSGQEFGSRYRKLDHRVLNPNYRLRMTHIERAGNELVKKRIGMTVPILKLQDKHKGEKPPTEIREVA
ncbi:hypothetical protein HQ545_00515 [Candidatus Woesearchaeota archaeon]|nr:hypothetical protein [Candidatus Woesearchaeota archaeon]